MTPIIYLLGGIIGLLITSVDFSGDTSYIPEMRSYNSYSYDNYDNLLTNNAQRVQLKLESKKDNLLDAKKNNLNDQIITDGSGTDVIPNDDEAVRQSILRAEAVWRGYFLTTGTAKSNNNDYSGNVFDDDEQDLLGFASTLKNKPANSILQEMYDKAELRLNWSTLSPLSRRKAFYQMVLLTRLVQVLNHFMNTSIYMPSWCNRSIPFKLSTDDNRYMSVAFENTRKFYELFTKELNKVVRIPRSCENHGEDINLWNSTCPTDFSNDWTHYSSGELTDAIKRCNESCQGIVDSEETGPREKLLAQLKIDSLKNFVTEWNNLFFSENLPNQWGGAIEAIEFKENYTYSKFWNDIQNEAPRREKARVKWSSAIEELFNKTWENKWYEPGNTIKEPLFPIREREEGLSLRDKLLNDTQKDFQEGINALIKKASDGVKNEKFCLEYRQRCLEKMRGYEVLKQIILNDICVNTTPWGKIHSFTFSGEFNLQQNILHSRGNDFESEEFDESKKWTAVIELYKSALDSDGNQLFDDRQRHLIDTFEDEETLDDARRAFSGNMFKFILRPKDEENNHDEEIITKNKGKRYVTLDNLRKELSQWVDLSGITSSDDEIKAVIKESSNEVYDGKQLFSEKEREKIMSLVDTAGGIDCIISNLQVNIHWFMSGLNYDTKRDAIQKLIEKLMKIRTERIATARKTFIRDTTEYNKTKTALAVEDKDRIRKRSLIDKVPRQNQGAFINAMNALDAIELEIGSPIKELCNSSELQDIENNLRKLEEECDSKEFSKIENATDASFNADRLSVTKEYFKIFDGKDPEAIRNINALNHIYSVLKFLLNMHSSVEHDKKMFNQYIDSIYGEEDKKSIEEIIKSYPNIIKMLSGWLFLEADFVNVASIKMSGVMYNRYVDLSDEDNYTMNFGEVTQSMPICSKTLCDLLLPRSDLSDVRIVETGGDIQKSNEKRILVLKKYNKDEVGFDDNFIDHFNKKNKDLFNYLKDAEYNNTNTFENRCVEHSKIVDFAQIVQDIVGEKNEDISFLKNLRTDIASYFTKIWGVGLGVVYRGIKDIDNGEHLFNPQRFLNAGSADDSYEYWIENNWDSFLSPQIKVSAYAFMKASSFKEILFNSEEQGMLTETYYSYKDYAEKKGEYPESLPVWLKMFGINLPNGKEECVDAIKVFATVDYNTWVKSKYKTKINNIDKKLEDLQKCYIKVKEDLKKNAEQKNVNNVDDIMNEGTFEKNDDLQEKNDQSMDEDKSDISSNEQHQDSEEWLAIKAPDNASEWVKAFYDIFKSKNTSGEHIFEIKEQFQPIINKCPTFNTWDDVEKELYSIRATLKRSIGLNHCNENEKKQIWLKLIFGQKHSRMCLIELTKMVNVYLIQKKIND